MRRIILVFLIMLFPCTAAFAYEQAAPMDFIFKGGEYIELSRFVLESPYKSNIPGPDGTILSFNYTGKCEMLLTGTDDNGIETYVAPKNLAFTKSPNPDIPAKGYIMGLIHEPLTSSLAWFVNDINNNASDKLWTRELTDEEYRLIGILSTITANAGTNAILVQYVGTAPGTSDIVLEITDADATEKFTRVEIKADRLPGYFQLPGGGILDIDKIEIENDIPVIYFEWARDPVV